jgi:proteasome accessory factor B
MPGPAYLPPTDLTLQEALALMVVSQELSRSETGVPFLEAAQSAALKVLSNLSGPLRTHVSEIGPYIQARLEPHHPLTGARLHYERLQLALQARRRIRLQYDSLFERAVISTLISPYALLFSRRSWYVIGRSSLHRAVRTFHLGRILNSEITDDTYRIPAGFSVSRHLGQAWRLIREPQARAQVIVRFQPLVARNVAEVAWHPTQVLSWNDDGSLDFRVVVEGLQEISWWILGYGDQAEVLEPPELRKLVAQRVQVMHERYSPSTTPRQRG